MLDIENQDINGVYPYQKIISELMVRKFSKQCYFEIAHVNWETSRINTIEKISNGTPLSLSSKSEINVMSYELVKSFIERSIDRNISGLQFSRVR